MNVLIKVDYSNERPTVSARKLHGFLEIGTDFRHWFPRMCEYGFAEGIDYTPVMAGEKLYPALVDVSDAPDAFNFPFQQVIRR